MAEGQFLGSKSRVVYTSDADQSIILTLDDDLITAGQSLPSYDPEEPPANVSGKPNRFKPRGVYWQATEGSLAGARKFLVCGSPDAPLYRTNAGTALAIDGVAGVTTGRRGERVTF
jgi:hypothetical protein